MTRDITGPCESWKRARWLVTCISPWIHSRENEPNHNGTICPSRPPSTPVTLSSLFSRAIICSRWLHLISSTLKWIHTGHTRKSLSLSFHLTLSLSPSLIMIRSCNTTPRDPFSSGLSLSLSLFHFCSVPFSNSLSLSLSLSLSAAHAASAVTAL